MHDRSLVGAGSPESIMLFTGNANPRLAADVSRHLGIPIGRATVARFSDGEGYVEILEHVRGRDVFILQSTCAPANDNLMEIMLMADALRRASAGRITAAIPYFGYARQDRRVRSARVPISAKVIANMLQAVGVDRVLTMDLHSDQIQGFFDIPVDNIYAAPIILADVWRQNMTNLMVVSPDVGGVVRARAFAKELDTDLAIIDKRRPKTNVSEVMNIIGDVQGRTCLIMDDMVDTAGTLTKAAAALKANGASRVVAYCTHPVLSGGAVMRVADSDLDELVVTDTIPLNGQLPPTDRIRAISCAALLAETIVRIAKSDSVSSLFLDYGFKQALTGLQHHPCGLRLRGSSAVGLGRSHFIFKEEPSMKISTSHGVATTRSLEGTGASRRLRRAGKLPGIVYGGVAAPVSIELDHNPILLALRMEAFHSSIITLTIDGQDEQVLLRDFQMHPFKQQVLHVDFQRVEASQKLHTKVPLHFVGAEVSPAVKLNGAVVNHVLNEIEVTCLPKDLPEFIEVDLSGMTVGHSVHTNDLKLPAGVTLVLHGQDNPVVATAQKLGGGSEAAEG